MEDGKSESFLLLGKMIFFIGEKPEECPYYLGLEIGIAQVAESVRILQSDVVQNILANAQGLPSRLNDYLPCWSCCMHVCSLREKAQRECNEFFKNVFRKP